MLYGLYIDGASLVENGSMHAVFDPIGHTIPNLRLSEPSSSIANQVFDLTPILSAPGVTALQRNDVGFALNALATTAGIRLYEGHFYKTAYWGARPAGLRVMKGTVAALCNSICDSWGYQVVNFGGDYLFWSNTWAFGRAADLPDTFVSKWRKRFERQRGFSLEDRIEMAHSLSWPQLRLTLDMILPESGPSESPSDVTRLQHLGTQGN